MEIIPRFEYSPFLNIPKVVKVWLKLISKPLFIAVIYLFSV